MMVCHCILGGTKACEHCSNGSLAPVQVQLGSTDETMHDPGPGPRRMLYRSSANIALLQEENRRLRAALEAALLYCEDIEMLKDARAMTTQYAWVRHRAPYPVAQIRAALAGGGKP